MSGVVRTLQLLGIVGFVVAGFLVSLQVVQRRPAPARGTFVPSIGARILGPAQPGVPRRPIPDMGEAVRRSVQTQSAIPLWRVRLWYPWGIAVLWLGALLWALRGPRARTQAGVVMALLTVAVLVLEAAYLYTDYAPFLPGTAGTVETAVVYAGVAFLLLYRRRADRHIGAVEAAVASQALLGFVHLLTLPSTMARPWFETFAIPDIVDVVFANFRTPFWVGCGALLVACVPVYLSRRVCRGSQDVARERATAPR